MRDADLRQYDEIAKPLIGVALNSFHGLAFLYRNLPVSGCCESMSFCLRRSDDAVVGL